MDYKKVVDNKRVHHIQHSSINKVKGQITSYDNYIINKVGEGIKKLIINLHYKFIKQKN